MRAGLVAAIAAARSEQEGYPKGSTVICAHCFVPLFVLTRTIEPGQKANRTVDAYRPISVAELAQLRRDVPSVAAALKLWTAEQAVAHVNRITQPRTGSSAECPACQRSFVQVFAPEAGEVMDQAYTWRLVTIQPMAGPLPVRSADVRYH